MFAIGAADIATPRGDIMAKCGYKNNDEFLEDFEAIFGKNYCGISPPNIFWDPAWRYFIDCKSKKHGLGYKLLSVVYKKKTGQNDWLFEYADGWRASVRWLASKNPECMDGFFPDEYTEWDPNAVQTPPPPVPACHGGAVLTKNERGDLVCSCPPATVQIPIPLPSGARFFQCVPRATPPRVEAWKPWKTFK